MYQKMYQKNSRKLWEWPCSWQFETPGLWSELGVKMKKTLREVTASDRPGEY